jgi:hypothetical protein
MAATDLGRLSLAASAIALLAAACASVRAQPAEPAPAAPAPQFRNLKVLPAAIPRENLMALMRRMSGALGVECSHCHTGEKGKMDFASDAKREKDIARAMMLMVRRINEQDFKVTDWRESKVTCFTCHRGAVKPLTATPPAPAA